MIESTAAGLGLNEVQAQNHHVVREQVHSTRENEKSREKRPVENAQGSLETESEKQDHGRTKTIINDNNVVVVEKYDAEGRLVKKTPPGYLPLSETL
jgi:hypothetical protein